MHAYITQWNFVSILRNIQLCCTPLPPLVIVEMGIVALHWTNIQHPFIVLNKHFMKNRVKILISFLTNSVPLYYLFIQWRASYTCVWEYTNADMVPFVVKCTTNSTRQVARSLVMPSLAANTTCWSFLLWAYRKEMVKVVNVILIYNKAHLIEEVVACGTVSNSSICEALEPNKYCF